MRESELEHKVRLLVRSAGGKAYKFVSPGNDGVPDRIVILPGGRIGFIELKQQGKKLRKLQQLRMRELEDLGCFTAVVDSEEAASRMIGSLNAVQDKTLDELFFEMINSTPHKSLTGGRT